MKVDKANATAHEVAGVLRRLAEAMDRNPRSWDELMGSQRNDR